MFRLASLGFLLLISSSAVLSAAESKFPETLSATGTVVDDKGKPVAGATVYLREQGTSRQSSSTETISDILAKTTTDESGTFAFKEVQAPKIEPEAWEYRNLPWSIVVVAKGHGLAWEDWRREQKSYLLRLRPEAKLRGRFVDKNGKPVAGAKVQVTAIVSLEEVLPGAFRSQLRVNWPSQLPLTATTNEEGKFLLEGLPRDRRITLFTTHEKFAKQSIEAATTDQPQPKRSIVEHTRSGPRQREETIHTGDFTAQLQPGLTLNGRVLFEDTGKPAAGSRVVRDNTATDDQGKFSLKQLAPGNLYVQIIPPKGSEYLGVIHQLELSADQQQSQQDFRLPRGVIVTGKVVDEETGKGIPQVTVYYDQEPAPLRESRPYVDRIRTGTDGAFRLIIPPGTGKVRIFGQALGYLIQDSSFGPASEKEGVNVHKVAGKLGQPISGVKFALKRGIRAAGRVLDPEGKPLPGALVQSLVGNPFTDEEGKFTLAGLDPERTYEVFITHHGRQLAGKTMSPQGKGKKELTLEVKLQRTASAAGRVLGEDKKPISNAAVQLMVIYPTVGGATGRAGGYSEPIFTAGDGTFRVDHLVPGDSQTINVSKKSFATTSSMVKAEVGQVHKLGDLILAKADQIVAGVVVDPAGNPLQGIQVQANLPRGGSLANNHAITDKEGRFRFTDLPKGRLQLSAYQLPTGQDRTLRGYVSLQAQAGKQDVQIILQIAAKERTVEAVAGKPAPEFPVQRWLNRKASPVALAPGVFQREDFRDKVLVLAFLDEAKPSQRVLAQLNPLHEKWGEKGLVILRVYETSTKGEELSKASPTPAALVEPGLVAGGYSKAFQKYSIKATPTLFLIDRKGILREVDVDTDSLERAIEKLLKP